MKKVAAILAILLVFLSFAGFEVLRKSENKVLAVIEPGIIQVDRNGNSIADKDETICIAGISMPQNLEKKDEIVFKYLAQEFTEKTLAGKKVKLKFTGEKTPECSVAAVYKDGQNFAEIFNRENFSKKAANIDKLTNKFNLVILNHKSNKFHTLECPYGHKGHDTVILKRSQLPDDAKPCKFCHTKTQTPAKTSTQTQSAQKTYPLIMTDGSIKLILTDFTLKLKPDKACDAPICRNILTEINSAKSALDIAAFGWDDVPAVSSAIKSAMARGVRVRLVYDVTADGKEYYDGTTKFAELIGNSVNDKSPNSTETAMLMHNKFIIIDNETVITGSMNFSSTGLSGFNANNLLIIKSPEAAQKFTDEFEQMYGGKFHTRKTSGGGKIGTLSIWFSPQDKVIYNQIIPLVNRSTVYVYMPAYIITHAEFAQSLISAKSRGVDVKIIIDATNPASSGSQIPKLRAAGVAVKTENYAGKMHSKTIIIDDKYLVIGSMNFSKSGETKNDENIVILENNRLAEYYKGYFNYIWAKIPDKYLKINPRSESFASIGSCTDGIDNNFDGKIDADDPGCKKP